MYISFGQSNYFRTGLMEDLRVYQIALKNITGIGAQRARALVKYFGGLEAVFEAEQRQWAEVLAVGPSTMRKMSRELAIESAKKELDFIERSGIDVVFFEHESYPRRLRHCSDAPILLYKKGTCDLNAKHTVSIIGTRKSSTYGKACVEELIKGLVPLEPLIVSGLALGVDTLAHEMAVQQGLQTVGVLGHSLDRIYPATNRGLAERMQSHGALLTEFEEGTKPDRENFPQRNRIVAGMADVVVVVETGVKGGSMITVSQALSYNRDVCAFPGRTDSKMSKGCNLLIKRNQAQLIEGAHDLMYIMGWEEKATHVPQKQLFLDLNSEEQVVFDRLSEEDHLSLDTLSIACGWPVSKTSNTLLQLEFKGVVRSLPGKRYSLT
jgi:DNA processing protein